MATWSLNCKLKRLSISTESTPYISIFGLCKNSRESSILDSRWLRRPVVKGLTETVSTRKKVCFQTAKKNRVARLIVLQRYQSLQRVKENKPQINYMNFKTSPIVTFITCFVDFRDANICYSDQQFVGQHALIRELEQRRRQRKRKRHPKIYLYFICATSRLFQLAQLLQKWRMIQEPNW